MIDRFQRRQRGRTMGDESRLGSMLAKVRARLGPGPVAVGALALAAVVALRVADPLPVQLARKWVFDTYQRIQPRAYEPAGVRVVTIDEASLDRYGQWPWPRTVLADLTTQLRRMGAAAVAFDIVFAEPDRTAPDQLIQAWAERGITERMRTAITALPDPDAVFAQAVAKGPVVTGFAPRHGGDSDASAASRPRRPAGMAFSGIDPAPYIPTFDAATENIPIIGRAAAGNGSVGLVNDPDNIVRRVPLVHSVDGRVYPSLVAEALRVGQGAQSHVIKTSTGSGEAYLGGRIGVSAMQIGRVIVPTTASGRVLLYDTGRVPARRVSAETVLTAEPGDDALAAKVRGHIVLIGASAAGLRDIRATPLDNAASGVSVQARVLEQMMLGEHLRRPTWAAGLELCVLIMLGGGLTLMLPRLSIPWAGAFGGFAVAVAVAGSWLAFDRANLLLDPVYPALGALMVYLPSSGVMYFRTEREKRFVRAAFSRYLSPALVERLAAQPQALRLGGEERELTVLFSDIRGFTGVTERMSPSEVTDFVNRFLTPMTEEVMARSGFVDKYVGDSVMAFWNAPVAVPDHPTEACHAALAMRGRLQELNAAWRSAYARSDRPFDAVAIGIGLNTGTCCVGNLGSEQRFNYSALGDNVNLASRLEGQTKTYGVDILMSAATADALGDAFATLELDWIRVKGRAAPSSIVTLVGGADVRADPAFAAFAGRHTEMLQAYRHQDWDAADTAARACLREVAEPPAWLPAGCTLAGVYELYLARIRHLRADPPGADWDAVFAPETK